jgi:hypothetical protein
MDQPIFFFGDTSSLCGPCYISWILDTSEVGPIIPQLPDSSACRLRKVWNNGKLGDSPVVVAIYGSMIYMVP